MIICNYRIIESPSSYSDSNVPYVQKHGEPILNFDHLPNCQVPHVSTLGLYLKVTLFCRGGFFEKAVKAAFARDGITLEGTKFYESKLCSRMKWKFSLGKLFLYFLVISHFRLIINCIALITFHNFSSKF